jgi:hypothetical protein
VGSVTRPAPRRRVGPPGALLGEGWIADDFDAPLDDLFDLPLAPRARTLP